MYSENDPKSHLQASSRFSSHWKVRRRVHSIIGLEEIHASISENDCHLMMVFLVLKLVSVYFIKLAKFLTFAYFLGKTGQYLTINVVV